MKAYCIHCGKDAEYPDELADLPLSCRHCGKQFVPGRTDRLVEPTGPQPPPTSQPETAPKVQLQDTKPCPFCAEPIKKAAVLCRHCREDLRPKGRGKALKKCKDCGREVSSKATSCPNCGRPIPKQASPLAVLLALLIVGPCAYAIFTSDCGGNDSSSRRTEQPMSGMPPRADDTKVAASVKQRVAYWVKGEVEVAPERPVALHSCEFRSAEGHKGLIRIVLDLRYDPRRFANPAKDLEMWATGALALVIPRAEPFDVRVSVQTVLEDDKCIPWCHARYWRYNGQKSFKKGPGFKLLEGP